MPDYQPIKTQRQANRRLQVLEEPALLPFNDEYESVELEVTKDDADWGDIVDVRGRDHLDILVEGTISTDGTQTAVTLEWEASADCSTETFAPVHGGHDVLFGDTNTLPTAPRSLTLDVTAYSGGATFKHWVQIKTCGYFMRFKPWGVASGSIAGARCSVKGLRVSEGS